ncbi:MAG TPA: gamma-glutamyltransferase family protein, partial [Dehalococcoidia bacterium]|nr:gamma-glutamyltransferase family protein [Dehalococcoidia bacterium]
MVEARSFNEAQLPEALAASGAPPRGSVAGRRFAVAADHPLTSLTAMNVLQGGGNAVDATIAAAAVNVVTKPNRTHLGGDAFALVWRRRDGEVEGLNAGGRAPMAGTLEAYADGIPRTGPRASTVPGLVDSWLELHARYGSRSLTELLQPAIGFCEEGFPVSLHLSTAMGTLGALPEGPLRRAFTRDGAPYRPGEVLRQPALGRTLRAIASEGRNGFYAGPVGRAIIAAMGAAGGLMTLDDLARPTAHWQTPIRAEYRGHTVYEQALPSQGMILLEALNIAEQSPLGEWGPLSADSVHMMVEATRLAFADLRRHGADPDFEDVPLDRLLSKDYAREVAAAIDMRHASGAAAVPISSDTTSFVVADEEMAVCYIQSVFAAWGSRFYVPEAGVLMNNRMTGFNLDPGSANCLAPGKRTVHTLNNFLVIKDGRLVIGGGTPGADFQVQTNLQVISAVVDGGLDLQAAVDLPRWATATGGRLSIESRAP